MDKSEIKTVCALLSRIETSEGADFRRALKGNAVKHCELLSNGDGALAIYKDENEYIVVCSFKNVERDYGTLRHVERVVTEYLRNLKPDETLSFVHGSDQIYLNNFVCKLNFDKPHYGLEYKLKRRDFACGEIDMKGLEARPYEYDSADKLIDIHTRAFNEQNTRAGHPEGYDEERLSYLKKQFSEPDDERTITVFYSDGELIGYTLFVGGYCDLIALDPNHQGSGFGKAMLEYSVQKAFGDEKIKHVRLHTFLINVKAQRLYESVGFKRVGAFCVNESKKQSDFCFALI